MAKVKTAAALGFFDGVHSGHRAVLKTAAAQKKNGLVPCAFTFPPESNAGKGTDYIYSSAEKNFIIEERCGIERIFSPSFADVCGFSGDTFARDILRKEMNAAYVVCGKDFRFGRGAAGDAELLKKLGEKYGFETVVLDKLALGGETVSSTVIKKHIAGGEIVRANELLGYRFGYRLPVIHGRELGRTWDFPTVNQLLPEEIVLPRFGVYCSRVKIGGKAYTGVTNIGVKPTVGAEKAPLAETYIIDFGGDLYGRVVEVGLERFIRPEKRFGSIDELRAQIARDTDEVRRSAAD